MSPTPGKTFLYMSIWAAYNNLPMKGLETHLSFCNQTWKRNHLLAFTILIKRNCSVLVVTWNYIKTCFETVWAASASLLRLCPEHTPLLLQPLLQRSSSPNIQCHCKKPYISQDFLIDNSLLTFLIDNYSSLFVCLFYIKDTLTKLKIFQ